MSRALSIAQARALKDRYSEADCVGVQDAILLQDFRNQDAFVRNLRDRFFSKLIYVRASHLYHILSFRSLLPTCSMFSLM